MSTTTHSVRPCPSCDARNYDYVLDVDWDPDCDTYQDAMRNAINERLSVGELLKCECYREPILVRLRSTIPIGLDDFQESGQLNLKADENGDRNFRAEYSLNVYRVLWGWQLEYHVIVHDCK